MRIIRTISKEYLAPADRCPICRGNISLIAQDQARHKYYDCSEGGCGIFRFSDNDMGQMVVTVELVDDLFIIT